jgi:multicomponent Na+:H+ antiporter subunit D
VDLAPLPVGVPLAGAAVLTALAWRARRRIVEPVALLIAIAVTIVCGLLLLRALDTPFVYWFGAWEPARGVALGISFTVDPTGAGLAALVAVLVTASFFFSWRYLEVYEPFFHVLMLVFLAATTGFCLSGDLFNMFVFFELMGVTAYALTGYRVEEGRPLQGALNFAVSNSIGAILILIGIGLLYGRTGALNLAQIGDVLAGQRPDGLVIAGFVFVTIGFFVKAAIVPFHFWLPDAHAVAPTSVCVLFSGVMVQLGLYAAARVFWTSFSSSIESADAVRNVMLGAGVLTALLAAVVCFEQLHLKRMLAFSTVSHMGLFLMGFALLDPHALAGTYFYVIGHGAVKAALFMCVGIVLHRLQAAHEIQLRGRGRELKFVGVCFALGGLLLAGLPPFGPWLGKALIDEASSPLGYHWIVVVFVVASAVTSGAILRAAGRVFVGWSPPDDREEKEFAFDEEEAAHTETLGPHDVTPWTMVAPMTALLIAGAAVGLWGSQSLEPAGAAADFFVDRVSYAELVLEGEPPPPPGPPPHAPALTGYLYGFGAAAGAVVCAWMALFRHKFSKDLRQRVFRVFDPPIDALRALHSGHIGDYVAWLTVGLAAFGGLFTILL